jgi:hypothetical protein
MSKKIGDIIGYVILFLIVVWILNRCVFSYFGGPQGRWSNTGMYNYKRRTFVYDIKKDGSYKYIRRDPDFSKVSSDERMAVEEKDLPHYDNVLESGNWVEQGKYIKFMHGSDISTFIRDGNSFYQGNLLTGTVFERDYY